MTNHNHEINLELTLTTGPNQNPNPVNPNPINPQLLPLLGNHHRQPPATGGIPPNQHRGKNGRFISIRPILPNVGPYSTDVNPHPQNARPFQSQGRSHFMHNIGEPTFSPNRINWAAPSSHTQATTPLCYERKRPRTRQLSVIIDSGAEERRTVKTSQYETGSSSQQNANTTQDIPQGLLVAMERKIEARYYEANLKLQTEAVSLRAQVLELKEHIKNLEMTFELATKQDPVVEQPTPLE